MNRNRITGAMLLHVGARCSPGDADSWASSLELALSRWPTANVNAVACVLGEAMHESAHFTSYVENLRYSSEERIREVFGARAGTNVAALVNNPQALGDRVYKPMGGYAARGAGLIQLTGLDNQQAFATFCGRTLATARFYLQTREGAALSAPWYIFERARMFERAQDGDFDLVTAGVLGKSREATIAMGKVIGLEDRRASFRGFVAALTPAQPVAAATVA